MPALDLELRHLRYFVAVAETLSFSRAAVRLHITQPALSRQIQGIEERVGAMLIERRGPRSELTVTGRGFYTRAREILAAAEELVIETRALAKSEHRHLRFGHCGTCWVNWFAPALRRFATRHPEVCVEITDQTPRGLVEALRRREIDVAILGPVDAGTAKEFLTRPICVFASVLLLPAAHPLAKRRRVALGELKDEDWIAWCRREFPGRRDGLVAACRTAGFEPRIRRELDSLASLFAYVALNGGVGHTLKIATEIPSRGVVAVELQAPGLPYQVNAVWRRERFPAPETSSLVDVMVETLGAGTGTGS